jgi:Na+-transporting methylmalonyl-CoA/oxaloacetate decarboxylase gamma subunit
MGVLVYVIIGINKNMNQRRLIAEQEFYDIADLASSAGLLSFMDETFNDIMLNALKRSVTLEALIISGPNGEEGFEREQGRALTWVNNSPRFRNRFDFSRQPLYQQLRINGLRNVTIRGVAGAFDYTEITKILKKALVPVIIAFVLAFLTLLMGALNRKQGKVEKQKEKKTDAAETVKETPKQNTETPKQNTRGGYSERGRIVRQENTESRLTEELRRCAAAGQDLSFIAMEFKLAVDDPSYARIAADTARFFSSRDFICERGERGFSVICPGLNLDAGFLNAGEFHTRLVGKYPSLIKSKTDLCIGLSARSGRPIDAERLMFEAEEALERAMMDPISFIVAFKSDPEKFRAFMESRGGNY